MILERALITVKPGQAEAFKQAFAKARPHIEGSKGCRKVEMRQGIEHPDDFLLLVWWDTLEDHNIGFRESPAFTEWRAILGPLFAAPPQVVHHQE
ncbi:MAG TPA: antibiotic biosynthesis monooxygenase, partial [Rhizomicrobium sp.]|nr:antibiotic biosynthesis monooxygenase [Rhizomicrobium sp.]